MPTVTGADTALGPAHQVRFTGDLQVPWTDGRVEPGSDPRILEDVVARMTEPLVGLVADEEADLVGDGHPGFGLSVTSDGRHLAARVFVAQGRVFEVIGVGDDGSGGAQVEASVRSCALGVSSAV